MYYYDYCNHIIIATAITIVIVIMIKTIIIFIIIIIVIAIRAKNGLHKWGRSWVDIIIYM